MDAKVLEALAYFIQESENDVKEVYLAEKILLFSKKHSTLTTLAEALSFLGYPVKFYSGDCISISTII